VGQPTLTPRAFAQKSGDNKAEEKAAYLRQKRLLRPSVALGFTVLLLIGCSRASGSGEIDGSTAPSTNVTPTATLTSAPTMATPVAAASLDPGGSGPCATVFNAVRCQSMVDYASIELRVDRANIVAIDVLPAAPPTMSASSIGPPIDIRVALRDGTTRELALQCGMPGAWVDAPCSDDPHIGVGGPPGQGYYDTPCTDDTPRVCATPVPTKAPDAIAAAVALRIDHVGIPIDHLGDFEVLLGEALLANGLLTKSGLSLVDDWPDDVTILHYGLWIEVRSLEPDGRPFENIYEHGWRKGTERVAAYLRFHVDRFDPGAVLQVRNVLVQ
jgi:hypothetical protein